MQSDADATLHHVRYLVEAIGPRSAGGPGEEAAADYAARALAALGLPVQIEPFTTPTSSWQPHIRALVLGLLARAVAELGRPGHVGAAMLSAAALGSALAEWNFRDHPIRATLRRAVSQNVVARIEPRGPVRGQVVVMGHLDSPNAPWAFRSLPRLLLLGALFYISILGAAANAVLYATGALERRPPLPNLRSHSVSRELVYAIRKACSCPSCPSWIGKSEFLIRTLEGAGDRARRAALPGSLALAALLVLALEGDRAAPSLGANDNASGAALALRLAERLAAAPLESARVWLVCSGAEEMGCYGALAFFRRHRIELADARVIVLESLGAAGPRYSTREGMLGGYRSDPLLLELAGRVAEAHPELRARPGVLLGGATEAGAAISRGLGALALVGLDERGALPHWHSQTDTLARIDPLALGRAESFAWELLAALDRSYRGR